jgi:hypothetical protein
MLILQCIPSASPACGASSFTHLQPLGIETVLAVPSCVSPLKTVRKGEFLYCADDGHNVLVPKKPSGTSQGIYPLTAAESQFLKRHNVRILEVPWAVPPGLAPCDGCAAKDLIRLHAMNMTEYDALVYFDFDITITGDIMPLLKCAATGELLMTEGGASPLNTGVMALKPSPAILEMLLWFSARATYDRNVTLIQQRKGAWDNTGAAPGVRPFPGMGCGQGLLWTALYGNGLGLKHAYSDLARQAGEQFMPDGVNAQLIDRCIYNYQRENHERSRRSCHPSWSCKDVIGMHKAYEAKHERPETDEVCWRTKVTRPTHINL